MAAGLAALTGGALAARLARWAGPVLRSDSDGPWRRAARLWPLAQGWRSQAARWIEAIVFVPVAVLAVIT
jgi:hypothetical protein